MTILTPTPNTSVTALIQYQCDQCGSKTQKLFRSWLQAHKISKKDWLCDFHKHSRLKDLCASCTIKQQHSKTPKHILQNRMNKARSALHKKQQKECQHEHMCFVCERHFLRKHKAAPKMCPECLNYYGGKNWMSRIPQSIFQEKIQPKMSQRFSGKNNPMFGKIAQHGHHTKLQLSNQEICLRSRWEAAFAIYLHKNNIDFIYEPCSYLLSNESTYTPDFSIPSWGAIVEVKGFWRDGAKLKYSLFCKEYNHLKIMLISQKELKNMIGFDPKNRHMLNSYISPYLL